MSTCACHWDSFGLILYETAHEMGHYCMSHNLKNMIIQQVYMAVWLCLFGECLAFLPLFQAFGFDSNPV